MTSFTSKAKAGTPFKFVATAAPVSTSQNLLLQESVKGKWVTAAKAKPNRAGAVKFTIKPKKGKHLYRVAKPASPAAGAGHSATVKVTAT